MELSGVSWKFCKKYDRRKPVRIFLELGENTTKIYEKYANQNQEMIIGIIEKIV